MKSSFRTVEGGLADLLAGVETLLAASLADGVLALLPDLVAADILLRVLRVAQGDLRLEVLKLEDGKHLLDDVDDVLKLRLHLIRTHEDVGVVLREGAHARQSVELAALLVAEDRAKLGDAQRQVLVGARLAREDLAVVRTVHRFEHILLVLLRGVDGLEGVLAVVGVVARGDVELLAADARRDDLLVVVGLEEAAQELLQAQAQLRALRGQMGRPLPTRSENMKSSISLPILRWSRFLASSSISRYSSSIFFFGKVMP